MTLINLWFHFKYDPSPIPTDAWLLLSSLTFPPLKILANDKQKTLSLSFALVSIVFKWKFSLLTSQGLEQGHFYLLMAICLFKESSPVLFFSIICCVFSGRHWVQGKWVVHTWKNHCQGEVTSTLWKANKTRNSRQERSGVSGFQADPSRSTSKTGPKDSSYKNWHA